MLSPLPREQPVELIAAPFTPFHPDGSLDLETVPVQARRLRDDGVRTAFVCGTTGEGASLTIDERMRVAARWCEEDGLAVIVHVGTANLADARQLAEHAATIGAAAVAAVPPFYQRPSSIDDLVGCCEYVAAAAADLPFLYYHIPSVTKVELPMDAFLSAASSQIPSFAGVKFTSDDLAEFSRCLEVAGDRLVVHFGRDQLLLAGLALGASSAVGTMYNFAAPLFQHLARAFAVGDLATARKAHAAARAMIELGASRGGLSGFKAISAILGVDCGPTRRPLPILDSAEIKQLREDLERTGFIEALAASSTA